MPRKTKLNLKGVKKQKSQKQSRRGTRNVKKRRSKKLNMKGGAAIIRCLSSFERKKLDKYKKGKQFYRIFDDFVKHIKKNEDSTNNKQQIKQSTNMKTVIAFLDEDEERRKIGNLLVESPEFITYQYQPNYYYELALKLDNPGTIPIVKETQNIRILDGESFQFNEETSKLFFQGFQGDELKKLFDFKPYQENRSVKPGVPVPQSYSQTNHLLLDIVDGKLVIKVNCWEYKYEVEKLTPIQSQERKKNHISSFIQGLHSGLTSLISRVCTGSELNFTKKIFFFYQEEKLEDGTQLSKEGRIIKKKLNEIMKKSKK